MDDLNIIEDVIDDIENELDDDDWIAADLKTDSVEDINNSMTMMRTMFLMFALVALILSIKGNLPVVMSTHRIIILKQKKYGYILMIKLFYWMLIMW